MKKLKKIIKPLLLLISFVLLSNILFAQIYQTNKYKEGINGKSTTLYATFDFNKIGEDVLIITLNQKQYVFIVLKTTIINYDPITDVTTFKLYLEGNAVIYFNSNFKAFIMNIINGDTKNDKCFWNSRD